MKYFHADEIFFSDFNDLFFGYLGEAGQDVDGLGGEVSSLLGALAGADTPAGVLDQ